MSWPAFKRIQRVGTSVSYPSALLCGRGNACGVVGIAARQSVRAASSGYKPSHATEAETRDAVQKSSKAFQQWKGVSGWQRKALLDKHPINVPLDNNIDRQTLSLLKSRFDDLEAALAADVRMSQALIHADRKGSVNLVEGAASTAISIDGKIPATIDNALVLSTREPFGPVLSIPAFNFPMTLALRSIVYPLACGNTVIMKASPYIPQIHDMLVTLFREAGFPEDAVQILHFSEDTVAERVEGLIADPGIRMVNFTGSTRLGRVLATQCGKYLKPSIMELGGKSPVVVLPSADLKVAANNILFGATVNSGQICMSTERVFAHESIVDQLASELEGGLDVFKGKHFELVRPGSASEVQGMIEEAVTAGAKLMAFKNGTEKAHSASDSSLPARIVRDPPRSSTIWTEETFSPTVTLSSYTTQAELLADIHSVPAGLSSSVFGDLASALKLAREIDSGAVHINSMTVHDEHNLPFGGVRDSGWGRFNGAGAVEGFTWVKNIRIGKGVVLPLEMV